jgi:sarcosine/dimethylglycine N-methyltransferase
MQDSHRTAVERFFDAHPINEDEILTKLRAKGLDLDSLSEAELQEFDQDHYGGTDAVDALAREANIGPALHVLDVCSGMGGPARWLAFRYGCRVTGVDLTQTRVDGATRLTRRVHLESTVRFVQGDATAMPFADATFDALISQEAWCHIPDKPALIAECARVLKPGARLAFTDIMVVGDLSPDDEARLLAGMTIPLPAKQAQYRELLEASGFASLQSTDLCSEWVVILRRRLEMYRSLRDTTVAKFGERRFQEYDAAYAHFVSLFSDGKLGGFRMSATHSTHAQVRA